MRFAPHNRRAAKLPGPRNRAGFTVLELVIVMFVAVLVGGMSLGKIHDIMNQQRLYRATSVLRTNVEAAFAIAARNRKPVRISWDATKMQLNVTDRAGSTVFRRAGLGQDPYGLPANSVTFSQSPLEVYPNGLANGTLLITLSANHVADTIRVSRAGLVQTQ